MQYNHEVIVPNEDLPFKMFLFEGSLTFYLNEVIGRETLSKYTANIAFAGFTAPKILWMKENEPDKFARISKIMLPKDYLAKMFMDQIMDAFLWREVQGGF